MFRKRTFLLAFLLVGTGCVSVPGSHPSEILALPVCAENVVGVRAQTLEDRTSSEVRRTMESLGWIEPSSGVEIVVVDRAARLQNNRVVAQALIDHYPTALRDRGIGGSVGFFILVDPVGNLVKTQLSEEAGYRAFNQAAADVMSVMYFNPATMSTCRLPFWGELVVTFEVGR